MKSNPFIFNNPVAVRFSAIPMIILLCVCNAIATPVVASDAYTSISLGSASLGLTAQGRPCDMEFADGTTVSLENQGPICYLESGDRKYAPLKMDWSDSAFQVTFEGFSTAHFSIQSGTGFTLFHLDSLELKTSATKFRLFRMPVPKSATAIGELNGYRFKNHKVALMTAGMNAHAFIESSKARSADRAGCSHKFLRNPKSKYGMFAAEFRAMSNDKHGGWTMQGKSFSKLIPADNLIGLSAWIKGDGKGEQLKLQLIDNVGGARDFYVPINFMGWEHVQITSDSLNTMRDNDIAGLNIYYNSLPPDTQVNCLIDNIRGIIAAPGQTTTTIPIEDFEDTESPWWNKPGQTLNLETEARYGLAPVTFGIVAAPESDFLDAVARFETAANLPSPHPGGVWSKKSPLVKQSYFFLTSFSESQFDDALALAKRGGFKQILLGQSSWCESAGHDEINKKNFPGGLPSLIKIIKRFRENGIDVGLHLLGASIDPDDPYITPVPDKRLAKDAAATLTHDIDAKTSTIAVEQSPVDFPAVDGGYRGKGTVIQIGDELISYDSRTTTAPFIFTGCRRGYLNTHAATHSAGSMARHLIRPYGYFMHDMDTSLFDEVTSNFARVANACDAGMIYFDGSENLQGDHWHYNAKLLDAYFAKLKRKDIIIQASSHSNFSWHIVSRSASADGHGDLKGYLEQRSTGFPYFANGDMPLDIGWYYGYDPSATPDMYEYILGTTIGYDSSMSFQVSVAAAKKQPFTGEVLDLISRYEKLRLSGRASAQMKALLRVPKDLRGKAPEDENRPTDERRDYHLVRKDGKDIFQRIVYETWKQSDDGKDSQWQTAITTGPAVIGIQIETLKDKSDQTIQNPWIEIGGHRLEWKGEIAQGQYLFIQPGESTKLYGPTLPAPKTFSAQTPKLTLPAGTYKVRFGSTKKSTVPYRVRLTIQPPERHIIPAEMETVDVFRYLGDVRTFFDICG